MKTSFLKHENTITLNLNRTGTKELLVKTQRVVNLVIVLFYFLINIKIINHMREREFYYEYSTSPDQQLSPSSTPLRCMHSERTRLLCCMSQHAA